LEKHKAMVEYMDARVGDTLDLVRGHPDLRDNTLVLFTSDNGTSFRITSQFNGASYRGGKAGSFDPGTHVAMVAWGLPGIPAVAETIALSRDLLLVEHTRARAHFGRNG